MKRRTAALIAVAGAVLPPVVVALVCYPMGTWLPGTLIAAVISIPQAARFYAENAR